MANEIENQVTQENSTTHSINLIRKLKKKFKSIFRKKIYSPLRKMKHIILGYPQTKTKNQRDPNSKFPRVIVSGRNYSSNLCLARAFGKAGYEVEVLRIYKSKPKALSMLKMLKPDAYSQYVKAFHICITRRKTERIITKLLHLADANRKMLLIPADDLVANIVDEHLETLSQFYLLPNINMTPGEINRMMGKDVQKDLAEKAGIPVINSCIIKTEEGLFQIPPSVSYPCFIKPNISKNGLKSKMQKCDTEEELRETITRLSGKKDIEMLVQDYIEIKKEYSILGVSAKNDVLGPGFFGADEGGHNERRGVAVNGTVLSCKMHEKLINDILHFITTLNFEGLFDVDLIESVDGKMYFVELNMRFGGSGYAITESGVNLPGIFADYMIQHKAIKEQTDVIVEPEKTFVSEKMLLEEYTKGFITWKELRTYIKQADIHFIQDDTDTRPYRHFRKFYLPAILFRKYYQWKIK